MSVVLSLLLGAALGYLAFEVVVTFLTVRALFMEPISSQQGLIGRTAQMRTDKFVFVDGALWKAISDEHLRVGDSVEIIDRDKLTLKVKRLNS
ncbi:MAG: NfeD family protein [bacterium]